MWWAFWRWRRRGAAPPVPPEVRPHGPARATGRGQQGADDEPGEPRPASPFSGASPDAADWELPDLVELSGREAAGPAVGPARASTGPRVARLAAAARDGDAAAVAALLDEMDVSGETGPSAEAAVAALAARLPALSGVTGPAAFTDEPPADLLRAYAELLITRVEPRRRRLAAPPTRGQVEQVARLAAALADRSVCADVGRRSDVAGTSATTDSPALPPGSGRAPDVPGVPLPPLPPGAARELFLASALLLVQTEEDGGGQLEELPTEITHLFPSG